MHILFVATSTSDMLQYLVSKSTRADLPHLHAVATVVARTRLRHALVERDAQLAVVQRGTRVVDVQQSTVTLHMNGIKRHHGNKNHELPLLSALEYHSFGPLVVQRALALDAHPVLLLQNANRGLGSRRDVHENPILVLVLCITRRGRRHLHDVNTRIQTMAGRR